MRHALKGRKLNRTSTHRLAMLRNLAAATLLHEQVHTPLPKAKEARRWVDRLITLGKRGDLHARRQAFSKLQSQTLVRKLFVDLAERYRTRSGGYTRVLKDGRRFGDSAEMAWLELVDRDPKAKGRPDRERIAKVSPSSVEEKLEKPKSKEPRKDSVSEVEKSPDKTPEVKQEPKQETKKKIRLFPEGLFGKRKKEPPAEKGGAGASTGRTRRGSSRKG